MNVQGLKLRRYYFKADPQKVPFLANQSMAQDQQLTCLPWEFVGNAESGPHWVRAAI